MFHDSYTVHVDLSIYISKNRQFSGKFKEQFTYFMKNTGDFTLIELYQNILLDRSSQQKMVIDIDITDLIREICTEKIEENKELDTYYETWIEELGECLDHVTSKHVENMYDDDDKKVSLFSNVNFDPIE